MPIDKRAVLLDLHVMMHFRLFGRCYWLADREACDALSRKLDDLGLQERVSGDEDTSRKRPLGNELPLDLIMVFLGLWDEWEMPNILERHGLIDGSTICWHQAEIRNGCFGPSFVRPFAIISTHQRFLSEVRN
jgi:hypothetical protein